MVLKSRVEAPDWGAGEDRLKEAKCRKHPLPTNHDVSQDPWFHDMAAAQEICNGTSDGVICPFRAQCLLMALINNEQSGVFGGLQPVQRRWIRRSIRRIPREAWSISELWRSVVPPMKHFEELDRLGITDITHE